MGLEPVSDPEDPFVAKWSGRFTVDRNPAVTEYNKHQVVIKKTEKAEAAQ